MEAGEESADGVMSPRPFFSQAHDAQTLSINKQDDLAEPHMGPQALCCSIQAWTLSGWKRRAPSILTEGKPDLRSR